MGAHPVVLAYSEQVSFKLELTFTALMPLITNHLERECFSSRKCRCPGLLRTVVAQASGCQLSGPQTGI